jgi:hypothetical protein
MSQLFCLETPRMDGIVLIASAFVSWINTIHSFPSDFHFLATPDWYNKLCTSPCPWGLVMILVLSLFNAILALLSIKAGTFSCFIISIYPFL